MTKPLIIYIRMISQWMKGLFQMFEIFGLFKKWSKTGNVTLRLKTKTFKKKHAHANTLTLRFNILNNFDFSQKIKIIKQRKKLSYMVHM